jgi:hypothetical protein
LFQTLTHDIEVYDFRPKWCVRTVQVVLQKSQDDFAEFPSAQAARFRLVLLKRLLYR